MTDTISTINYNENDKIFLKIREKFKEKLKKLFICEDYDQIIKYVFEYVFKDKTPKEKCKADFEAIFHDKTNSIVDFLWNIVDESVNESKNENQNEKEKGNFKHEKSRKPIRRKRISFPKGNNKKIKKGKMRIGSKEVILHNKKRERSRNNNNNYNEEYQSGYGRGFYNQRGRFSNVMSMRGRGAFGFYPSPIMNPFIQSRPPFFSSLGKHPKPKESNVENSNLENVKTEEKKSQEQKEENQKEKENIIDSEQFKKMTPEEQKSILEKREAKKKIRCKNWPNCKDPNCEYTHPTQTCPYFPNCMFGDKCSYIHPNVPCKYGFYCTRIGCSYSHPAGWNPGMGMFPNVMHPIPYKGKKKFVSSNEEKNDNEVNDNVGNVNNENEGNSNVQRNVVVEEKKVPEE